MSTWFDEEVSCPSCGHVQTARLAHGVHVARAPEVRDQLFARTFHRVVCGGCGAPFIAQRSLVYTDFDRGHWVQVALLDERARWPELEDLTDAVFERAFVGAPMAAELRDRFRRRLVFGLEELREKLVIWRANLDDARIECVKVALVAREPALSRERLVVDEVRADGSLAVHAGTRILDVPPPLVEDARFDPQLPRRFPELFGGRYVSIDRLLGPRYRWSQPGG
jgi:CpXC motif protein